MPRGAQRPSPGSDRTRSYRPQPFATAYATHQSIHHQRRSRTLQEGCDGHPSPLSPESARRCKPGRSPPMARSTFRALLLSRSIDYRENGSQIGLHCLDGLRIQCRPGNGSQLTALSIVVDLLPGAIDCVLLRVEKLLHQHDQLDLPPLVHTISRAILGRVQKLELTLPIPQDVRLEIRECAHISDGKELLHRFLRFHSSTSERSSLVMSADIPLRADWPSKSTRFTASIIGISTPARTASSRALCAVTTPSATVSVPLSTSSNFAPFPISRPTARFRLRDPVHVNTRSPSPASPANVLCSAPSAIPRGVIPARPRVMSAALALKPSPNPPAIPVATAITFFSAPPSSTPITSL